MTGKEPPQQVYRQQVVAFWRVTFCVTVKGRTIHSILHSLSESERRELLVTLQRAPEDKLMAIAAAYIMERETYSDSELMRKVKLKRIAKDTLLADLGTRLLQFNGYGHSKTVGINCLILAERVIQNLDFESGAVLLATGLQDAQQQEDYPVVMDVWKMAEWGRVEGHLMGMSMQEAQRRQIRVLQLQLALNRLHEIKNERLVPALLQEMQESKALAEDTLKTFPDSRLLQWWAHKVLAVAYTLQENWLEAISHQEQLISLQSSFPLISVNSAHTLLSEQRRLLKLYLATGHTDRAMIALQDLQATAVNGSYSALFKEEVSFPILISIALDMGWEQEGRHACEDFLKILSRRGHGHPPTFITDSLYASAYFYLAIQDYKALSRVLLLLNRHQRKDFTPVFFLSMKLIRLVRAIDLQDWEDAGSLLTWLRAESTKADFTGLAEACKFLEAWIAPELYPERGLAKAEPDIAALKAALKDTTLLRCFDLPAWAEARTLGCPLIEVFRKRAAHGA